ncbi:MAG TPA: 6-bladed beta-propeller [Gemmatimonadales bacterium]|nr:6-bladed beta-propeller [Gemmatimonadales bacterium]
MAGPSIGGGVFSLGGEVSGCGRGAGFALIGALIAGCGRHADAPVGQTASLISADSIPLFDVAGTAPDGTPVFGTVTGGARFDDGRILIANASGPNLIVFDSAGRYVRTIGREGHGPGEFQWPNWVGRCGGDSIFVRDQRLDRITVIAPDATPAREIRFPYATAELACSTSARFIVMKTPLSAPVSMTGTAPPMMAQFLVTDAAGDSLAGMGTMKAGETRPLGLLTRLAMTDDRIYLGTADSAFVDVYNLSGARVGALRVGGDRRPPTPADYDHAIEQMVAVFPGQADRDQTAKLLRTVPMPALLPAYSALLTDPEGVLWAVTSGPGDSITTIRGTSPDGSALGELKLPDFFRPFEVGLGYVLGAAETPDGEQHVREYRVRRNRERPR